MEFRHYYLSKELIKQGYNVTIILASYSHLFKNKPEIKKQYTLENIDGINYLWIKVPNYKFSTDKKRVLKCFIYAFQLFRLPLNLIQSPSYIIVSPIQAMPIYPASRLAKKFNAKLIFEVRDIWPLSIINYINSLPIKMFEYMSAGIPIIISNFPLWKSIIDENQCCICVDPMNPEEISKAIKYIIGNLDVSQKMGENGRRAVLEK